MNIDAVLIAFGLTLFAGLATGIGSILVFFTKRTNVKFLSVALGFSAGVMIYISFVEIFFSARQSLVDQLGIIRGSWLTVISFFCGILLIAIIDKLVPSFENPHSVRGIEDLNKSAGHDELMRMGFISAIAIAVHNFPEGIATFTASVKDINLGIPIAVAIAIHNIPEGIAVAVPLYYATGDKKKAFILSFLSGLSEPLGALTGYLFLYRFFNDVVFGIIFGIIAGIMVFISFDELLPASEKYGEHHLSIYGLIAGMAVMAVSLLIFG